MFRTYVKYILFSFTLLAFSCACKKKGCTNPDAYNYSENAKKDDGSCIFPPGAEVKFKFRHSFESTNISNLDLDKVNFTNAHGELMSFTKLQYLLSDFRLYKMDGDSVFIKCYHLVDITQSDYVNFKIPALITFGSYSGIGFNLGFTSANNNSGAYADLNAASWSWPEMLGGGYHQLKLEGRFVSTIGDTIGYTYHSGSRIREISGTDTNFYSNELFIKLPIVEFNLEKNITIELNMDISKWFSTPNLWDLNVLNNALMSNYNAQIMMRENGADVFSVGTISE